MAETPTPPLFDLGDPAMRWTQTTEGFRIERRFRLRTLTFPLTLTLAALLVLWSALRQGDVFVAVVMGLGASLWSIFLLIRIRVHDTVTLGREALAWRQRWPRDFQGTWSRGDLGGVRLVYDRKPRWHDHLHVQVEIEHDGRWVEIASASTLGSAPARRRAERLAEALSLSLARPLQRVIAER